MALPSLRATIVTFGLAALMVVSLTPMAFAPHVVRVEVEPGAGSPGDEISVYGPVGYGAENPVEIHWNEPDGEVLATVETEGGGFYTQWGPVDIAIPEDATSGQNHFVATQELAEGEGHIRGLPAYAAVQVIDGAEAGEAEGSDGTAVDPGVERTGTLEAAEPPGAPLLVLIGVGTLAIALAVAGLVARAVRGGGTSTQAKKSTS